MKDRILISGLVLAVACCGFLGYKVYDYSAKTTDCNVVVNESNEVSENKNSENTNTSVSISMSNLKLNYEAVEFAVGGISNAKSNVELITDEAKFYYAWADAMIELAEDVTEEKYNGQYVTGYYGIDYDNFELLYKNLWGNNLPDYSNYTHYGDYESGSYLKNGNKMYGFFWSNYPEYSDYYYMIKDISINDDSYTVDAYLLKYDDISSVNPLDVQDYKNYEQYKQYVKKEVKYVIKKVNEDYLLNSFMIIK